MSFYTATYWNVKSFMFLIVLKIELLVLSEKEK